MFASLITIERMRVDATWQRSATRALALQLTLRYQTSKLLHGYQILEDFPLRVRTSAVLPNVAITWLNVQHQNMATPH